MKKNLLEDFKEIIFYVLVAIVAGLIVLFSFLKHGQSNISFEDACVVSFVIVVVLLLIIIPINFTIKKNKK